MPNAFEEVVIKGRRPLRSYGQLAEARPQVVHPRDVADLRRIIKKARESKRRVTFRGGGHAFDSQSLNDDLVISLERWDWIGPIQRIPSSPGPGAGDARQPGLPEDPPDATVTVGPGARWGAIVKKALAKGYLPDVVVTSSDATAGGTLAANCLSRRSPLEGRERNQVLGFKLLAPNDECERKDPYECNRSQNPDIFDEVIGGMGYLGAVTEITYHLQKIGLNVRVETEVAKYEGFEDLIPKLIAGTGEVLEEDLRLQQEQAVRSAAVSTLRPKPEWAAVYSVAFFTGRAERGVVFRSRYRPLSKEDAEAERGIARRKWMRIAGLLMLAVAWAALGGVWARVGDHRLWVDAWLVWGGSYRPAAPPHLLLASLAAPAGLLGAAILASGWRRPWRPVRSDMKAESDKRNRRVLRERWVGATLLGVGLGFWALAVRDAIGAGPILGLLLAGLGGLILVLLGWWKVPEVRIPAGFRRVKRFLLFQRKGLFRTALEYCVRIGFLSRMIWKFSYSILDDDTLYRDPLEDYTFFMDANSRAKRLAGWLGLRLPSVQQTFLLPQENLEGFLGRLKQTLESYELRPTLFDILFVKKDRDCCSPRRQEDRYAVSIAFEDLSRPALRRLTRLSHPPDQPEKGCMEEINGICADCGGRFSLVKNVYATREQFQAMQGPHMAEFWRLKARLDPDGILKNEFFDRLFVQGLPNAPPAGGTSPRAERRLDADRRHQPDRRRQPDRRSQVDRRLQPDRRYSSDVPPRAAATPRGGEAPGPGQP